MDSIGFSEDLVKVKFSAVLLVQSISSVLHFRPFQEQKIFFLASCISA